MHASRGIRRPHRKTKTGCKTCRQRRVKCDEDHPHCRNCLKRGVLCVWEESPALAYTPPSDESSPISVATASTPSVTSSHSGSGDRQLARSNGLGMMDMLSIELMHYYMAHTSLSLMSSPYPEGIHCLQVMAPRLAIRDAALLHSLFALTALHIHIVENDFVGTSSSRDFMDIARNHFAYSVEALPPPSTISYDPDISGTLFIAYGFLLLYIFAAPTSADEPHPFHWIRSAKDFAVGMFHHWDPFSGKERPLVPPGVRIEMHKEHLAGSPRLPFPELLRYIHLNGAPEPEELEDPETCSVYEEAVRQLEYLWHASLKDTMEHFHLTIWPYCMPEAFFDLIMEKRSRALVILAHYCIMIGQFQQFWLSRNRGKSDVRTILGLIGKEWTPWMQLPISQLEVPEQDSHLSALEAMVLTHHLIS